MSISGRIKKGFETFKGSIRRRKLGLGIFDEEREAWYDRSPLGTFLKAHKSLPHKFVSDYDEIFRQNIWLLHANAKKALAARSILDLSPEIQERLSHLERRREWNLWRGAEKLLDYFPSFKFSDSKLPIAIPLNMKIKNFLRQMIVTFNVNLALANSRNCYKNSTVRSESFVQIGKYGRRLFQFEIYFFEGL